MRYVVGPMFGCALVVVLVFDVPSDVTHYPVSCGWVLAFGWSSSVSQRRSLLSEVLIQGWQKWSFSHPSTLVIVLGAWSLVNAFIITSSSSHHGTCLGSAGPTPSFKSTALATASSFQVSARATGL